MTGEGSSAKGAIRAFVAVDIGATLRVRIGEVVASLRAHIGGIRWVAAEGIHLTLRFLGSSCPDALAALEPALRAAAAACPACEARATGLGMFPERGSPRVLWLAIDLPEPVLALQAACEKAAVAAGFPPETRPFRSHLTLGRWRDRAPRPSLPELDAGATLLDSLVLFRSDLRPQGAVYTPLATFRLRPR